MQALHCSMTIRVVTKMYFHGRDSGRSRCMGQSLTLFYLIILLPTFINITLHGQICNGTTTKCGGGNYTEGSTFEKNLKIVFDRLAEGANKTGFNISVYGQSPNRIYGLLQCREDMTADQCFSCWQFATTNIRQDCGTAVGGSIWPFQCFLRYGNYNFIGQLDTDLGSNYAEAFGNTVVFVPTDFEGTAQNLLEKLSIEAASETKRSAFSTALDSASQTIYGLVQCTRDLSTRDCRRCLSYSISKVFTSDTAAGIQYWSQSCILRYGIYPFFNSAAFALNSTQGVANKADEAKSSHKGTHTILILGVVGGLALVFMACLFATGKRLKSATFGKGYEDEENRATDPDGHMVFKMETLRGATNNFHDDNKLGEEGFGPVYKDPTKPAFVTSPVS